MEVTLRLTASLGILMCILPLESKPILNFIQIEEIKRRKEKEEEEKFDTKIY